MSNPETQIGKYVIQEQIGEGAMGIVYRGVDPLLNRTVAIKVMSEGLARDDALRARFLREAQAAGSLQHPNVVTIYDFGEVDAHLFIAMEYIAGADLEEMLESRQPLTLAQKLDIVVDVLNGLSYAHRRGIVHRDIKPANIRIDEDGRARIMDFGVAHLSSSNLTTTGMMMGTPMYMAPEQIVGEAVTPLADIFSVGAVLYELLTGNKPFQADTLHGVLYKIVTDPPPALSAMLPSLPPALLAIVDQALAKDPAARHASALDMANALSAVRGKLSAQEHPSRTLSLRSSIEIALKKRAAAARTANAWLIIGVAAAFVVVVAAVGVFAFQRGAADVATRVAKSPPAPAPAVTQAAAPIGTPAVTHDDTVTPTEPAAPAPSTRRTAETPVSKAVVSKLPVAAPADTSPAAQPPTVIRSPDSTTKSAATSGVPAPVPVTAPASATASTPAENPRTAIPSIVVAYARAIGTRDVAQVRKAYPGMTTDQQSAWQSFFDSIRSMKAMLDLGALDARASAATAQLTGVYEYVTREGRTERQNVAFQASFQLSNGHWVLVAIR